MLRRPLVVVAAVVAMVVTVLVGACSSGPAVAPTPGPPGTAAAPRELNLIAKDDEFVPTVLELYPGETILLHVINGGLEPHEAVLGDDTVQTAWEAAEAATVGAPPGPTPTVSVPPDVAGLRVAVASGQRVDVTWTVPDGPPAAAWTVGCHIPGHFAKGMHIAIRWLVRPAASP